MEEKTAGKAVTKTLSEFIPLIPDVMLPQMSLAPEISEMDRLSYMHDAGARPVPVKDVLRVLARLLDRDVISNSKVVVLRVWYSDHLRRVYFTALPTGLHGDDDKIIYSEYLRQYIWWVAIPPKMGFREGFIHKLNECLVGWFAKSRHRIDLNVDEFPVSSNQETWGFVTCIDDPPERTWGIPTSLSTSGSICPVVTAFTEL